MKNRILIVDDEPNIRLSYRVTLEAGDLAVVEAANARQALDRCAEQTFDLVLLDLQMPETPGLDLLAQMRERGISAPVIIITAYGDIAHAVQAMRLGAIDFLQKPMTPDLLRGAVGAILERHAPGQEAARETLGAKFEMHVTEAKRLMNLRDFTRAKEHLVRALELRGEDVEALNLAGVLLEMQEDFARAKKYYGRAIRQDPHYEPAQQNMRRIFELFNFGSSEEPFAMGNDVPNR